jgi:hypothetical protein
MTATKGAASSLAMDRTAFGNRWPFGMSRAIADDYVGFSAGHFDKMVAEGRMPAPRREGSRLVWLRDELEAALRALPSKGEDEGPNEWDNAA